MIKKKILFLFNIKGNTGRSIAFFDYQADEPIVQHLVKIMSDAKQTVPDFLAKYVQGASAGTSFGAARSAFGGGTGNTVDN